MTYDIDWLPGERIVFGKIHADYSVPRDTPAASARLIEVLETSDEPVPYVLDLSDMSMNFAEMVGAMGLLTKGDLAAFVHPKLRELNIVSESTLVKMGAISLGQSQYGGRRANVFATVEEALAHARRDSVPSSQAA